MQLSSIVAAAASCVGAAAIASARFNNGWKNLPTLALAYASATGFVVALAATPSAANRGSAALLGKRDDGSFSPLALAAFAPFHLGLRAKLAFQRAKGTESSWDEVMPLPGRRGEGGGASGRGEDEDGARRGRRPRREDVASLPYYLGGWPHEVDSLPPGVTAIVDVTAELPRIALRSRAPRACPRPPPTARASYLSLRTWDTHGPTPEQIERGVRWISEMRRGEVTGRGSGRKVLVHCAHGHGRSVTVLAAALLAERREEDEGNPPSPSCPSPADDDGIDEVLVHIQKFRPRAKLNSRQRGALEAWLRTRRGKERENEKNVEKKK